MRPPRRMAERVAEAVLAERARCARRGRLCLRDPAAGVGSLDCAALDDGGQLSARSRGDPPRPRNAGTARSARDGGVPPGERAALGPPIHAVDHAVRRAGDLLPRGGSGSLGFDDIVTPHVGRSDLAGLRRSPGDPRVRHGARLDALAMATRSPHTSRGRLPDPSKDRRIRCASTRPKAPRRSSRRTATSRTRRVRRRRARPATRCVRRRSQRSARAVRSGAARPTKPSRPGEASWRGGGPSSTTSTGTAGGTPSCTETIRKPPIRARSRFASGKSSVTWRWGSRTS